MSETHHLQSPPGFVLESADSVRFGPEYGRDEQERNRQMLFGELLCGLLMGEQLWTNAVFLFDSRGAVEVLSAIARASKRNKDPKQFLPFFLSVYPSDRDTWVDKQRDWENPGELYLRCYAHRLNNINFNLSATPELNMDQARRKQLASEVRAIATDGGSIQDIKVNCTLDEMKHLDSLFHIDCYIRSWLGSASKIGFKQYVGSNGEFPIRLNRTDWQNDYLDGKKVGSLRYFLEKADQKANETTNPFNATAECKDVLRAALNLQATDIAFNNRSEFRKWIGCQGYSITSPVYRVLTELIDGHYVRTQQSVLTFADREVTSPASQSRDSQDGERWASATMQTCLTSRNKNPSWQFINEIKTAISDTPLRIDLDTIADCFTNYMESPDRRSDLLYYHQLLSEARKYQGNQKGQGKSHGSNCLKRLGDIANKCCNGINSHLSKSCNVNFYFNITDPTTGAGSLTFVYLQNKAINQCTANPQVVSGDQSEGTSHAIRQP